MFAFKLIKKIGEAKGWSTLSKHITYGLERGYHVALSEEGLYRKIVISFSTINDSNKNRLSDILFSQKKQLKINRIEIYDNVLVIHPNEFWKVINLCRFQIIIDSVISTLKSLNIVPMTICPVCKKGDTDTNIPIEGGSFMPFHKSCYDQQLQKSK